MGRIRVLGKLAAVILALFPQARAQDFTHHMACEISAGERGGSICWLSKAKVRLTCDLSVGQPRPQCVTQDGFFADCIYRPRSLAGRARWAQVRYGGGVPRRAAVVREGVGTHFGEDHAGDEEQPSRRSRRLDG